MARSRLSAAVELREAVFPVLDTAAVSAPAKDMPFCSAAALSA